MYYLDYRSIQFHAATCDLLSVMSCPGCHLSWSRHSYVGFHYHPNLISTATGTGQKVLTKSWASPGIPEYTISALERWSWICLKFGPDIFCSLLHERCQQALTLQLHAWMFWSAWRSSESVENWLGDCFSRQSIIMFPCYFWPANWSTWRISEWQLLLERLQRCSTWGKTRFQRLSERDAGMSLQPERSCLLSQWREM